MEEMFDQCTEMMKQMGDTMGGGMMGGGMMGGMMGNTASDLWWASPWYWLGWGLLLALLVAAVLGMVWVVRRNGRLAPAGESPMQTLKLRFARGEVSPEQFEAMKRQLAEA